MIMNEIQKKDINRKCNNNYEIKIKALQEKIKRLEFEKKELRNNINDLKITSKVIKNHWKTKTTKDGETK